MTAPAPMAFVGKRFLFRYESGLEVVGHYKSPTALDWEARTGPAKGTRGSERIHAVEVAPGIFFVSWLEEKGTTVSQVLDLNKSQVTAFVTFDTGTARQGLLDRGTLRELPP